MKTPTLIARGIKRLLEMNGMKEFRQVNELFTIVNLHQAGGTILPELANRNGNRYSKDGTGNHGGTRLKGNPGKKSGWTVVH